MSLTMKSASSLFAGAFAPTMELDRARAIMGTNFFGVEDAIKHFKLEPAAEDLATLGEPPFSESQLEAHKDSHILVAVLPLAILDLNRKVDRSLFHNQTWYKSGNDGKSPEPFAQDPGKAGWHLVRKTPVAGSAAKCWSEQAPLIGEHQEVPEARVVIYTVMGHCVATGERLLPSEHVRTSTIESAGLRVGVGGFDSNGLFLAAWWDEARNPQLGVSSAWKA